MRNRAEWLRSIRVVVAAAPLAAVCCRYAAPAPHFSSQQVDNIPFDSIRAYANTLQFDSVVGAADLKRVAFDTMLGNSPRLDANGDLARIEPEMSAWALDSNQLAEGRIIARIRTTSFHRAFGYSPRWTWWWVDKRGGHWRSLYLSDSLARGIRDTLRIRTHLGYEWRQSLARWGSQWATCGVTWCCETGPAFQ
jgi:hypothetical protein